MEITSPEDGSSAVGRQVTFTGTVTNSGDTHGPVVALAGSCTAGCDISAVLEH